VPALAETYPGFAATTWLGLFAPAGTPSAVVSRLHGAVNRILQLADTRERFAAAGGVEPLPTSLEQFRAMLQADDAKYSKLIREINLRVE
jgi:tripartite-type tricarboxylate transporter receptor subunit TctC